MEDLILICLFLTSVCRQRTDDLFVNPLAFYDMAFNCGPKWTLN